MQVSGQMVISGEGHHLTRNLHIMAYMESQQSSSESQSKWRNQRRMLRASRNYSYQRSTGTTSLSSDSLILVWRAFWVAAMPVVTHIMWYRTGEFCACSNMTSTGSCACIVLMALRWRKKIQFDDRNFFGGATEKKTEQQSLKVVWQGKSLSFQKNPGWQSLSVY